MPKPVQYITYGLMIVTGLIAMYTLLNAGNPDSLLRPYLPDPRHDVYLALVSSVLVFILGFLVFFSRDREGFRQLVDLNADQIRKLTNSGRSDEEIAASILAAMGSYSGYKHNLALKKLVIALSEYKHKPA